MMRAVVAALKQDLDNGVVVRSTFQSTFVVLSLSNTHFLSLLAHPCLPQNLPSVAQAFADTEADVERARIAAGEESVVVSESTSA